MPVFKRGSFDRLTGLQGRESFYARVTKEVSRSPEAAWCVMYLRLLNLGAYNVRHGVAAGEKMLKLVASYLVEWLSKDMVCRLESNGFLAATSTGRIAERIDAINRRLPESSETDGLVLKAGYCLLARGSTVQETTRRACYAFEDIRFSGVVYTRLFDQGLETSYARRRYVTNHLDDAIERGEIRAYAQPIVRVLTGMICEVEILARWESEEFGFLRPDEFVPELERHQLIHRLDAEVIRLACKQWSEAHGQGINVPFGINLSRLDFELIDMFEVVTHYMDVYGVPKEQVHIEITESALAQSNDLLLTGIRRFRDAGFKLYLDDFGSGYSSLRVLEGTSFDVVKLDMSLLREVEENERARVIVSDAVSMVKRLNLQTLCEGVETEEQYQFLKAVGCEKAQGYYFSRPMSHEDIMAHLVETAHLHETSEDQRYYDSLGKVNLMDGTRSSVHGVEAAHFMSTQPFALIEVLGQSIGILSANVAFSRFVENSGAHSIDDLVDRMSSDLADLRNKLLYATSKARATHRSQLIDFVMRGNFCTFGVSHIESSEGRNAYLLELISVTRYSKFNDFKLLEDSLRFLYTIFKRIDLLDATDNTWRNLYLNVPRYTGLKTSPEATPQNEVDAFCETFIHPDDRASFLAFYDLSTAEDRLRKSSTTYLADTFFALSDNDRYEDQLFMLIPMSMDGHRQYLSCMRDLDVAALARQHVSGSSRIADDVLLTGILDVTERLVFWKDEHLRFLGANERFLDYYGFSGIKEILGKTDEDLGWTRNAHFVTDERRVMRGERVLDVVGYTVRRGEARDIMVSKMPLWLEGRVVGLVGFLVDVGPHEEDA